MTDNDNNKPEKIAILYSFLKCQGGGERLLFTIRDYFKADFWTGAIRSDVYSPEKKDSFSGHLYNGIGSVYTLCEDSTIPIWYAIKRQLYFMFSPKIKELAKYNTVVTSGNIAWVGERLRKIAAKNNHKIKLISYVNTPPRLLTDQKNRILDKIPTKLLKKLVDNLLIAVLKHSFTRELKSMDYVFTNSGNIKKRLFDYTGIDTEWIFPPVDLDRFKYLSTGDYFISYSRLEDLKRIKLIVETFKNLPDKKLIICSTGPLKNWVIENIANHPNIEYRGLVSDQELSELVGNCLAGVTIPENEDAGLTQLEIMAASKPVIGVAEGGLLDTVIDMKTGILIPAHPTEADLTKAIKMMTREMALEMKNDCRKQAENFSIELFFDKWNKYQC